MIIVHYAADLWEHVCPVVRVVAPLQHAGLRHVHGNEWQAGQLCVFPERVADADLVIIQRDFPRYVAEYDSVITQARALGKPVVYELDDLLTELPAQHPDVEFYGKARAAILQAVVEADAVTGSTPLLCDYLREFNPNVWLLSNYLDDQLWPLDTPKWTDVPKNRPVTIGYLGSHAHLSDLEMIAPVLMRVLERYGERIAFKFWGIIPPAPLIEYAQVAWSIPGLVSYAKFAMFFAKQECDIFIAPLQDNLFNRCKSPLKFLEYSARGIPGVYSHIAPYVSVVEHGQNGFLAATLEEWEEHLARLIDAPDLRRQLGLAAQQTVRTQWLLSRQAEQWTATYRQICNAAQESKPNIATRVAREMHTWYQELAERNDLLGTQLVEREQAIQSLSTQLVEREQAIQSLSTQLAEKEQTVQSLRTELVALKSSTGWGLLQLLWRLRLWFAPRGSWRERVLRLGMRGLRVWRQEGFLTFAQHGARIVTRHLRQDAGAVGDVVQLQSPLQLVVETGTPYPSPAISVVIVRDTGVPEIDVQAVTEWVATQTYRAVQIVIWSKESKVAWPVGASASQWDAWDVAALCHGLNGRYLCIASPDLLQQNEMYLEANLIALETESLAFTINVYGKPDWVVRQIEAGRLPGDSTQPLLRQVVRKDCLQNNWELDLSAWLAARNKTSVVVGKIVAHTTNRADEDTLPFEAKIDGADLLVLDHWIVMRLDRAATSTISHVLHPVDSVLPLMPESSPLPTVLVVIPFLAVGGAERVHLDVMRRLKDQFRFVMITLEPFDASLGTTADAFREVTPYIYTAPDYLAMPLNFSIMTYLIKRFQPRTLYIANGTTWIYDALCMLKSCFPHLRMVNQVYDHKAGWINRYEPDLVASLDAHIGTNRKICQAYIERGAKPGQVYLIEHGVDPDEFDPARVSVEQQRALKTHLGFKPEQKIVTFIGRLHPQKRPMDFVEIARRFKHDPSLKFLMIGDGPLASTVETEIARIGLINLVRRSFYHPSREIFAISDVVVLPSEYEGMPLVVLEAQIMGKPVVVTDVGNTREILEVTGAGVIVPNIGDITSLVNGVRKMLDTPPHSAQLRQTVISRFGLQNTVEKYRQVLLGE